MTKDQISETIMQVARGDISINEGAKLLSMTLIDFERLMNFWEDAQQAWDKMMGIAIISELKRGKTDEEIKENFDCSEGEIERDKRLLRRTLGAIDEVREGSKTPGCASCIAGVYISEFARMMEEAKNENNIGKDDE